MRAFFCVLLLLCAPGCSTTPMTNDGGDASPADATADATSDVQPMMDVTNEPDASVKLRAFVARKIFLGDSDRNFVASSNAWKDFGLNIDGKISTSQSMDVCKLMMGAPASVHNNGTNGIDNSFGANIVPIFQSASGQQDLSKQASAGLEQGSSPSLALWIDKLGNLQDYAMLAGAGLKVFGPVPPLWMGADTWAASSRSVMGSLTQPVLTLPSGKMQTRHYSSGLAAPNPATLELGVVGLAFVIPLRHLVVETNIAPDNSAATLGVISAVMNTEEFVEAMRQVVGQANASLCMGGVWDSIAQQIRQASDILDDGTQDPQKTCNAISIGLGFEAVAADIATIVNDPPPPKPCP